MAIASQATNEAEEAVVVVLKDVVEERSGGHPIAPSPQELPPSTDAPHPGHDELGALGLAALVNDLVVRGVGPTVAHKWLQARTPEYLRELLAYHDWCQTHRKGFIHDSGAWLARSLAEPICFPTFYLKAQEAESRRAEREAAEAQERIQREAEERRQLIEELSRDPDDHARRQLEFYERSREALHRSPLTEQQRSEQLQRYKTGFLDWRERVRAEEPELRPHLVDVPRSLAASVPAEAQESQTRAQLEAWQQERRVAGDAQALANEADRLRRSPEERAEAALHGLDEHADALGEPRLTGSDREARRGRLLEWFRREAQHQPIGREQGEGQCPKNVPVEAAHVRVAASNGAGRSVHHPPETDG